LKKMRQGGETHILPETVLSSTSLQAAHSSAASQGQESPPIGRPTRKGSAIQKICLPSPLSASCTQEGFLFTQVQQGSWPSGGRIAGTRAQAPPRRRTPSPSEDTKKQAEDAQARANQACKNAKREGTPTCGLDPESYDYPAVEEPSFHPFGLHTWGKTPHYKRPPSGPPQVGRQPGQKP